MNKVKKIASSITQEENVSIQLRDKDGNLRRLFQQNFFGNELLRLIRAVISEPIDQKTAQVKSGLFNRLAAYGLQIPGVTGSYVTELKAHNLVTSAGKAGLASRANGVGAEAIFQYIGIGTGAVAAAAGDTALGAEKAADGSSSTTHAGSSPTLSRVTTSVTNDTAQSVVTINFTGSIAITEYGLFNATNAGTMCCRQVQSAINVVSGDSLQVTWKLQFS